jgi:PBP1b-binding outer membrane lipoprotein LpoB
MARVLLVMAVAFLITGCNGEVEPQAEAEAEERESIFDPMTDQIEKARKVEAQAMQHKDDIDKALEDADAAEHE